jgi:16S rRNA processing protein RimM
MSQSHAARPARRSTSSHQSYTLRNRQVHVPTGYVAVGLIIGAHSLRGELKVEPHTDFPERFAPGAVVFMGLDLEPLVIAASRPHKAVILIRVDTVTDRTQAEALAGQWLFIKESDTAVLDDDTYFIHDIIGVTVVTGEGKRLGVVTDVLQTGANDVYVIAADDDPAREILIPAIAEVIQSVDLETGVILVNLLPGLEA